MPDDTQAPDIPVSIPQGIPQIPPSQGQAPLQVPTMQGRTPNVVEFIKQMANPTASLQPGDVAPRPPSRLNAFESFLGNFLQSFAAGMSVPGGPNADKQAFGAAINAPYQNDLQNYQLQQQARAQQSLEDERKSEALYRLAQVENIPAALMAKIQSAIDANQTKRDIASIQGQNQLAVQGARNTGSANVATINTASKEADRQQKEDQFKQQMEFKRQSLKDTLAKDYAGQAVRGNQLTAATRTMVEAAPRVKDFVSKINKQIDDMGKGLGPAASRYREFQAGKVGIADPAFTKLRTDVGLLQTLLMRMHVGARGGQLIMGHFKDLIDSGKQSPENLKAALEEIGSYADDIQKEGQPSGGAGPQATHRFNPATGKIEPINAK